MISYECADIYESSGLEGEFCFLHPGFTPSICFPDYTEYYCLDDETDEEFLDRIERSKRVGRNLFKEEWTKDEPEGRPYYDYIR